LGVLAGSGLLLASACSSGTSASGAAGTSAPATAPAAAAGQTAAHTPATAAVGKSQLGPIVVDSSGRTLYRFDKDTAGNGMSACNGACAAAWPAALVTGQATAAPGLTGTLGTITRADGSHQLTLNGSPLYRYVGDQGPGDTTGNGFGGIWHVVHTTAAPAAAAAGASGY
jgi:predicted lipoprotein with Yx(FWY)xxD motif